MEPHDQEDADFLRTYGWQVAIRPQWGEAIWQYRDGGKILYAKTQSSAIKMVRSKLAKIAKTAMQQVS